jgi:hypothetical protein
MLNKSVHQLGVSKNLPGPAEAKNRLPYQSLLVLLSLSQLLLPP